MRLLRADWSGTNLFSTTEQAVVQTADGRSFSGRPASLWPQLAQIELPARAALVIPHGNPQVSDDQLAIAAELAIRGFIAFTEVAHPTDSGDWFVRPGTHLHAYGRSVSAFGREPQPDRVPIAEWLCLRPAVLRRRLADTALTTALGDWLAAHPDWLGYAPVATVR